MWPFKSDVSISRNYSEISLRDKGWSRVCCNSDRGRTCSSHNNCKLKAGYAYQKVWKTFGQCALRFLSVRIQFFSRVAGCRYRWQSVGVSVIRCCEKRNTLSIKRSDVGTGQNQTKTRKFVSHVILEPTIRRPENSIRLARSPCGEEIDGAYKNLSVAVPNSFRTSVGKFLAKSTTRAVSEVDNGIKSSKSSIPKYYYLFYKKGQFYYRFNIFHNIISEKSRIIRA